MKAKKHTARVVFGGLALILLIMACGQTPDTSSTPLPEAPAVQTPTPTSAGGGLSDEEEPPPVSKCDGLSGDLEMQVLVGPADAVELESVAVGDIPFTVTAEGDIYTVQGGGAVTYEDVLEKDWGTYTVSFDMEGTLSGECAGEAGSEILNIMATMSGEQMVEIRSKGYQADFPWSGTQELDLSFPLEEGAVTEGEGWSFILHLDN